MTYSPTVQVDVELAAGATLEWPPEYPERGVYVAGGDCCWTELPSRPDNWRCWNPARRHGWKPEPPLASCWGGEPLDGRRFIYWNFVARSRERIEVAKADWAESRFDPIPGEAEFIPPPWL